MCNVRCYYRTCQLISHRLYHSLIGHLFSTQLSSPHICTCGACPIPLHHQCCYKQICFSNYALPFFSPCMYETQVCTSCTVGSTDNTTCDISSCCVSVCVPHDQRQKARVRMRARTIPGTKVRFSTEPYRRETHGGFHTQESKEVCRECRVHRENQRHLQQCS